ncbi:MAG: Rrf2 family transcriptional regulator [Candidatus Cloacimonetes bacterium]|nr:Rrf2 family transcriptional regulator [Candidatus Cloacimonadota bacterium]
MSHLINVSEAASLALHGLAIVAQQSPNKVNAKYLAEKLNASEAHLAKIFQRLSKSGIIRSFRGPTGGFVLNKPAEEISFLDIYEIVESKIIPNDCPLHKTGCPFENCIFGDTLKNISNNIYQTFKNIKLSDFTE